MSKYRGYEIEIGFGRETDRNHWDVLLIKGERSHAMTFSVALTLSSVENSIYSEIEKLIKEEEKK
jgi:hypothetical protein